jgi:chromosomal replication initiation ATPase DnaA
MHIGEQLLSTDKQYGMIKTVTIDDVLNAVSEIAEIPIDVLVAPDVQTLSVTYWRHIAMYCMCKLTFRSLRDISMRFGKRDHSSVYYAINKVSQMLIDGKPLKTGDDVEKVKARIGG